MSIFRKMRLECPVCATPIDFDVVLSVSADRRPDLREAILDGSFQRLPCPGCGTEARADPEFTYMDIGRGQYIGVWPAGKRADWKTWAEKTRAVFDDALGKNAPSEARGIGAYAQFMAREMALIGGGRIAGPPVGVVVVERGFRR